MDKIYEQAKDLHVKSRVVYAGPGDYLFDELGSEATPTKVEEAFDAYVKGLLLIKRSDGPIDAWLRPIGFVKGTDGTNPAVYTFTPGEESVFETWGFVTEDSDDSSDSDPIEIQV